MIYYLWEKIMAGLVHLPVNRDLKNILWIHFFFVNYIVNNSAGIDLGEVWVKKEVPNG